MIRALDIVRAAVEPQSNGDWHWVHIETPPQTEALMRRIQLRCAQKRLAPVKRAMSRLASPQKHVSYSLLFKGTSDRRRYLMNLYGVSKKLGATPELLEALDPRKLDQEYVSRMRVEQGSEVWKFLVKYGFQTEPATAAVEPRQHHGVVEALRALLVRFENGKRLPSIKGHTVEGKSEPNLLVVSALSPDRRHCYSLQAYEFYDVPAPGVEVEVSTENGRSVRHRMPDNMSRDQLLRKMMQLLSDRIPGEATAAAEPKATQDLSRAFSVLLEKFKTPRTTTIQGHVVKITCGDDDLADMLFLRTTRADGEEHEVWACDVEIGGKIAIEIAVPDRERSGPAPGGAHLQYIHHVAGPDDLLQQLVRYLVLSYKAVHATTAAAEPNQMNVEALDHVFKQMRGTAYAKGSSPSTRGRTYVAAIDYVMTEARKPIWTRPTLILVTQILVRDVGTEVSTRVGQQPNHAYFDPETNELVVLGQVGSVKPVEIGRTHVTDARAAVKYILQCLIKHDDPLRSWR